MYSPTEDESAILALNTVINKAIRSNLLRPVAK